MGMGVSGSAKSGRGRRGRSKRAPMSEINVTPFVDVMLVLLIIFMVTAPLMSVGIVVEPPETRAPAIPASNKEQLQVSVDANGQVFLQETKMSTIGELVPKLDEITKNFKGEKPMVWVTGDRRMCPAFDSFSKVVARVEEAGYPYGLGQAPGDR